MMLHKIFHMTQSVEEARRRLSNVNNYRHQLDGVERADINAEGTSHWNLRLPLGFNADFVLNHVSVDDNTVMFKSIDGDIEIGGVITFTKIKKNLTEVDVTLNYESNSVTFNVLDRLFRIGDHFLVSQLQRVRAHFEGSTVSARQTEQYFPGLKHASV